jgi:hypothetical protein
MDERHIIPIGKDCGVAISLRVLGIRKTAYPWDWARYTRVSDIMDVIKQKDTFQVSKWRNFQNIHEFLPHDNPGDSHGVLENRFENTTLLEKYTRRFERFFEHIKLSNTYMVRFGPKEDIPEIDELSKLLPNVKVVFIENGADSDTQTYEILKSIFTEQKDSTFLFLESMLKIYDDGSVPYPCNLDKILEIAEQKQLQLHPEYVDYLKEYQQSDTLFRDKYTLIHYIYQSLKNKGIEYCIL